MDDELGLALLRHMQLRTEAELLIGERSWFLLSCYGKLMSGPHAGSYVSALATSEQRALVKQLVDGDVVEVHLMHRHRSGHYEASSLRWAEGELVMVFKDREVPA